MLKYLFSRIEFNHQPKPRLWKNMSRDYHNLQNLLCWMILENIIFQQLFWPQTIQLLHNELMHLWIQNKCHNMNNQIDLVWQLNMTVTCDLKSGLLTRYIRWRIGYCYHPNLDLLLSKLCASYQIVQSIVNMHDRTLKPEQTLTHPRHLLYWFSYSEIRYTIT